MRIERTPNTTSAKLNEPPLSLIAKLIAKLTSQS